MRATHLASEGVVDISWMIGGRDADVTKRQSIDVSPDQVRGYRASRTHLNRRLAATELGKAAYGGLQDSAPRSALLALHARVEGVAPDAWEHTDLVQIWFRGADYVVPRESVGVFTLGTLTRDAARAEWLNHVADKVVAALDGEPRKPQDLAPKIDAWNENRFLGRILSSTGKIHIRWDASTIVVVPAEPASMDPEDARLELLRRFLHWYAPASTVQFAKWAGLERADAALTWERLATETTQVEFDGRKSVLSEDLADLLASGPSEGVRMLPMGDPYLYLDQKVVAPAAPIRTESPTISRRLINSLGGRILHDGELVGSWGRVQAKVSIDLWADGDDRRDLIEQECLRMASPLGRAVQIRWLYWP